MLRAAISDTRLALQSAVTGEVGQHVVGLLIPRWLADVRVTIAVPYNGKFVGHILEGTW